MKMSKSLNSLYKIAARKISGQASYDENHRLDQWINSSHKAKDTYSDLERIWSQRYFSEEDMELVSQEESREKIWESAFENEESSKHGRFNSSFFIKLVAAIIILLTTTFALFYTFDTNQEEVLQVTTTIKQTLPGQKSTITLRDGTVVSLNSGSKISYLSNYNDSLRIIKLEGQAFFDVFKDKTKPFIVKCRNLEVEALGTSFDVNGFSDVSIQVSLLSGSVRLKLSGELEDNNMILNPGEFSIVDKNNEFIKKGIFNPEEILAWKEGRLIFEDALIGEIIPKLELWYGVKIVNFLSVNSEKPFTGTFEKENLDNILHNMGRVMDFDYKINGNIVKIN